MWNANNQPPGAFGGGGRRRPRSKKRKAAYPERLKRVSAQAKTNAGVLAAQVILNDFHATHMEFFTTIPLQQGDSVAITMDHPRRFFANGKVLWCEDISNGQKIIAEKRYQFRVRMQFTLEGEEQIKALADFTKEIHGELVIETKKKAA